MQERKLSIKEWAEDDRPREKMMKKGIHSLSNTELIAILFGTGTRNGSAVELARDLLDKSGNNLNNLARLGIKDITKIKGIGKVKAISILTALELGKRRSSEEIFKRQVIKSSQDVYQFLGPRMGDLPHEEFWVLLLNQSNAIIEEVKISQGGITGTVADIRLIFKSALDKMATGIILVHNHPSGGLKPSDKDENLTKKIVEAGRLIDINVLDHIIVTQSGYFSFADEGII